MAKHGQVHIAVDEAQKARWRGHVDESNRFESLTDLIRVSVEKELSADDESVGEPSPGLSSDIKQIEEDVERIRKNVQWLRDHHQHEKDDADVAQEVFDSLKTLPDVTPGKGADAGREEFAASTGVQEYGAQTVQALAEEVDTSPTRIADALEHLREQFMPVVEVTLENQRHYFKED